MRSRRRSDGQEVMSGETFLISDQMFVTFVAVTMEIGDKEQLKFYGYLGNIYCFTSAFN